MSLTATAAAPTLAPHQSAGGQRLSVLAEGVVKSFGKTTALAGVGFHGSGPAILGVCGPNASGKTTLIRILLGLVRPDSGRVEIGGVAPRRLLGRPGLHAGYMPQSEALYGDLTARQNLRFFARLQGVPRQARAEAVSKALAFAELEDRADDRVSDLSGGMRRRVSLACALVHEPRILALDEPTVGIDPELRAQMWNRFHALKAGGSLILISTHYLAEAERCDAVLLLRDGKAIALDTPVGLQRKTGTHNLEDAFLRLIGKEPATP